MGLGVGATVPEFTLPDHDGKQQSLSAILQSAEKGLVLFFYPKDETSGCVAEVSQRYQPLSELTTPPPLPEYGICVDVIASVL